MKRYIKGMLTLIMSLVICLQMISPTVVNAAANNTASEQAIEMLKRMEGFVMKPYWDNTQYSVGYGTRCPDDKYEMYKNIGISREDAESLLREHIQLVSNEINRFDANNNLNLSQQEFDALLLFSYNVGTAWMNENSEVKATVVGNKAGNDFLYAFGRWSNVGDRAKTGLANRRLMEANLYLNGIYEVNVPVQYGYTVLELNDGSNKSVIQCFELGSQDNIRYSPAIEGKTFYGWLLNGATISSVSDLTKGATLYANWDAPQIEEDKDTIVEEVKTEQNPVIGGIPTKVISESVNIRSGPGKNHDIIDNVKEDEELLITKTDYDGTIFWGKCDKGWIALTSTDYDTSSLRAQQAVLSGELEIPIYGGNVRADILRIRQGAGTQNPICGELRRGDYVEIFESTELNGNKWGRISKTGWIHLGYVNYHEIGQSVEAEVPNLEAEANTPAVEAAPQPDSATTTTETEQPANNVNQNGINISESTGETPIYEGNVIADALRVRQGAGTEKALLGKVYGGQKVSIYEIAEAAGAAWGRITGDGWVHLGYVNYFPLGTKENDETAVAGGSEAKVTASCLRVRKEPSTSANIVDSLFKTEKISVGETREVNGELWGNIGNGWVSLKYTTYKTI